MNTLYFDYLMNELEATLVDGLEEGILNPKGLAQELSKVYLQFRRLRSFGITYSKRLEEGNLTLEVQNWGHHNKS